MTGRQKNRPSAPGKKEQTTLRRVKGQGHDQLGSKSLLNPNTQVGGREEQSGDNKNSQELGTLDAGKMRPHSIAL